MLNLLYLHIHNVVQKVCVEFVRSACYYVGFSQVLFPPTPQRCGKEWVVELHVEE